jgi:hypothetical protein
MKTFFFRLKGLIVRLSGLRTWLSTISIPQWLVGLVSRLQGYGKIDPAMQGSPLLSVWEPVPFDFRVEWHPSLKPDEIKLIRHRFRLALREADKW